MAHSEGRRSRYLSFLCFAAVVIMQNYASAEEVPRRIAPEFHVRLLGETVVNAEDIQGKVTVLDFWAPWCKPCLAEIPEYNDFYRAYKDRGVVFLALATEAGKEEKVREAVQRFSIEYPVAVPTKKEFKAIGKIRELPTTWIVGPDGIIQKEFVGVVSGKKEAIRDVVDRLLSENTR